MYSINTSTIHFIFQGSVSYILVKPQTDFPQINWLFLSIIANEVYNKYTTFKLQLNRKLSFFHMWNALRQFSNKEKRGITQTSRYKCVFPYLQEGIMTRAVFPALSWKLHKQLFFCPLCWSWISPWFLFCYWFMLLSYCAYFPVLCFRHWVEGLLCVIMN